MDDERITTGQAINLLILFITGSTLILGTGLGAKNDVWLAILLAIGLAVPAVFIYARILSLFPGQDLFAILRACFGKFFGGLISIFYIWYVFHLGALVLRNFGEFITTVGLPETPLLIPMGVLALLCLWIVKEGVETMGRWASLFVFILYLIVLGTTLLSLPNIRVENLGPVLYNGLQPVIQSTFSSFAFPFAEVVIFLMVLSSLGKGKSPIKVYLTGLFVAGGAILLASVRNLVVLGADMLSSVYFPSYLTVRTVSIGDFLERVEITVAVGLLIGGFIKIAICLLGVCKGVAFLAGLRDYRSIATPIAFLMLLLAYIVYDSIMEMYTWAFNVWTLYSLPFQVLIPIVVWIVAEVKKKKPA